ncbi:DNA helicase UvrD [Candidatus Uhrbacteria bacterium]|nr:DNA helicase UvrD [Candidatus Uhrbacteria bacterium]
MRVIADLHIHSRFARACSKEMNLPNLDRWAKIKGVQILGTGDAFHPVWRKELREGLVPAEEGLFVVGDQSLEPRTPALAGSRLGGGCVPEPQTKTRFMLTTEVACIYKQGDKVRRIHYIIFAPSFESIDGMVQALEKRGCNLKSDGRPIIGVHSQELLKMVLAHGGVLIPAHAWTPWFAIFGSKSGFDSIEECFGGLSNEIFAIETGLSSDPPMNWRVSALDRVALLSNSDAHSLPNLAREANILELTRLSYAEIVESIKNGAPIRRQQIARESLAQFSHLNATIEFYPEEGMYHVDGHRACGIQWMPEETKRHGGRCTRCGLLVTVGVLNRVSHLADRNDALPPLGAPLFHHLVELDKIIAEAMSISSRTSKKVQEHYRQLIELGGSELEILLNHPLSQLAQWTTAPIVEGIRRVRSEQLHIRPGYDGVYGQRSNGKSVRLLGKDFSDKFGFGFGVQASMDS